MTMREGLNLTNVKVGGTETQRSHSKGARREYKGRSARRSMSVVRNTRVVLGSGRAVKDIS